MSARRRAKVVPISPPAVTRPAPLIDHDLLDEARKDAFLLLVALDGFDRHGTYMHEDNEVQMGALQNLALVVSRKLAKIGRQAAGEPEP